MRDRLAHHGPQPGHAIRQPLRHMPAVQRQVSASGSSSHQSIIAIAAADSNAADRLLEQAVS
jgi:hypothetical protein